MKTKIQYLLSALTLLASLPRAGADTSANTAITYQGLIANQLDHGSNTADIVFTLFSTNSGGGPVGGPITNTAIAVNSNGLFMTTMDFGSNVFNGSTHWLQIAVRTNGGGVFTILAPRQLITATPQAIFALSAGSAAIATLATNFSGAVSGDVSGPQGATVVASVGGQTAANVATGVIAANAATSSNLPNTLVKRDGGGSFSAGSVTLAGALYLPLPAIIYAGGNPTLIDEGSFFAGGAGNMTLSGGNDVGVGRNALHSLTTGSYNTAIGEQALQFNTTGLHNTANGFQALYSNTSGYDNTANGPDALYFNTSGFENTANGTFALEYNTTGYRNTANGVYALYSNTNGSDNTANGFEALYSNTTGNDNTANGVAALNSNTTGSENTANGVAALEFNTSGNDNTANGYEALYLNTTAWRNTANGREALRDNTTGGNNTANGYAALEFNTSGSLNTANGAGALALNTGSYNTAIGEESLDNNTSGSNNIALGYLAGRNLTTGSYNIDIGNLGLAGDNNTIRIGTQGTQTNTFVAGIWGTALGTNAQFVVVDSSGHLGTNAAGGGGPGVASVTGSQHISATPATGAVVVGSDATSLPTPGTLVSRDNNGSFSATNITLGGGLNCGGQLGVLNLPTTTANAGMITLGGCNIPFLHAYGFQNFFGGVNAGNLTLTGSANTGTGYGALNQNTSGNNNTANGYRALEFNTSGSNNTANGEAALYNNTSGANNTANGETALFRNTSGNYDTANGYGALYNNTNGDNNTADGWGALNNSTGSNNIGVGYLAGNGLMTGNNDIYIGNQGTGCNYVNTENGIIRIGTIGVHTNTYLAGTVYANCSQLSDRNAKENFKPVDAQAVLAKVAALPVTEWNYKTDSKAAQHIGPMAQDFQAAFGLSGPDDKHISVVDEGGVALAAIQGLNQKVEELKNALTHSDAENTELKQQNDSLAQRLNELEAAVKSLVEKK